jgi:signal transduction histidine kinase
MSIKFKLVLSNIAMIIIPIVLTGVLFIALLSSYDYKLSTFKGEKGKLILERNMEKIVSNYIELIYLAQNDADKFNDNKFLKNIEKGISNKSVGLVVIVDNKINYVSKYFKGITIVKNENFDDGHKREFKREFRVNYNEKRLTYYSNDLNFKNGKTGKLFIIFDLNPLTEFVYNFVTHFLNGMLIILFLTTTILTIIVSRSIILPIKKLKFGAEQIKDGNLSFEINENSKDEIGQTCRAFEEMRVRLKEAIENQVKLDEDRVEFIASITHDLKTPITAIKGYIEGIMDGIADTPEKLDKYTKTIYSKAVDMDKLIDNLTFYSNKTLNKIPFNYTILNIKRFLEDFVDENSLELENKDIILNTKFDINDDVKVKVDIEKLKRVMLNIVNNSVKYMDKDKKIIKIDLKLLNNKIIIGIHDNGIGVNEEYIDHIFEKFYRADPSRNTSRGGSGLGLAISKQIIEEHQGRIWAKSIYKQSMSVFFELDEYGKLG